MVRHVIPTKEMSPATKNAYLKRVRDELISKITPHEKIFMASLDQLGVKYKFQKPYQGSTFAAVVDFFLQSPYHAIVEIDGQSHFSEQGIRKDAWKKKEIFQRHGCRIVHISNDFIDRNRFIESLGVKQDNFGIRLFEILKEIKKLKHNGCLNYY